MGSTSLINRNMSVSELENSTGIPDTQGFGDYASLSDSEQVNILIVDDLPENQLVYKTILEELGQNLVTASSGEEALKLVLQHDFAVILLDVNMTGMDGFETATMIRQRKKSALIPIIFLSAFTDEMRRSQGYASGAVDYLPTPIVPEVLKAKVRVFIELSLMRRQWAIQAAAQATERAKRTAAEEADKRKDEFLGMLAHELRNPLGPILNAAQLLHKIAPQERRFEQLCEIIERQVTHMAKLIDDLLDATRLAHGKILLRKERGDLCGIVRQTAEDYRSILETKGLKLFLDVPDTALWIECDPTRLVQAIGNLLHNATKYTPAGGLVTVRLAMENQNRTAVITVSDTGIGIDSKILPYVFDVFRQAEQGLDRGQGGLGLGLALVRGLVELHGGKVSAASDGIGKGARFSIRLPVEILAAATAPNASVPTLVNDTRRRILVIEDNHDAAETTKLLLSDDGYEVQTASTGPDGLETAKIFKPQIILCDIGLPGMDGYQVARSLRQDTDLSTSYIIALTGYGQRNNQLQTQEAGFDMQITKPIDYNNLRRTLAAMA